MSREYHSVEAYREAGWGDEAESFFAFMDKIDRVCLRLVGVSVFDLPDQDFASAFEAGENPIDIAREILLEEGADI